MGTDDDRNRFWVVRISGRDVDLSLSAANRCVLTAWALVVSTAGIVAIALDYDQIWWGAVVLYVVLIVDFVEAYFESHVHGRDAETLTTVGITVVILSLHSLIYNVLENVVFELLASQIIAIAGVAARGYAIINNSESLRSGFEPSDQVTHPFITVGATTTVLLGLIVSSAGLSIFGLTPFDLGSGLTFFLLLTIGASTGLFAHLLDGEFTQG